MLAVRALARRRLTPSASLICRTNTTLDTVSSAAGSVSPPSPPQSAGLDPKPKISPAPRPTSSAADASKSTAPASGASAGEEAAPEAGRKTRRRFAKKRAQISLAAPRKWNVPLRAHLLPVYDEALKLINSDSARLKRELRGVLARVAEGERELEGAEGAARAALERELGELREKAGILEIQSDINRPSIRWNAANGMGDLNRLVYRHLVEQKWRRYGTLDLLMERIHQMGVVPDVVPALHPSIDLRLSFPEPPPFSTYLRTRTRRKHKPVEPGVFILPEQSRRPPRLYTSVFHPETRYYTLVLVDADVPDPENTSFTTFLHWLQPNIPLSAGTCGHLSAHPHTGYVPPHPQRGSPYHRYCLFLLPHANPEQKIVVPAVPDAARLGFDLRAFCAEHGLDAGAGGAAHMWREVWDETVSDIYKHTLKRPEPRFGLPPRVDPYAEVKSMKRFVK
ncbi:PEBP-like protein [Phellopilus nigrolimitatus]|nr:PEBP-like protein [Phellopilus nigrolimitatus]